MNYSYQAFGLRIDSFIELEELHPQTSDDLPVIKIVQESIASDVPPPSPESSSNFQATPDSFFFRIARAGSYQVTRQRITVDLEPEYDRGLFKTFLYGSVFSASLYYNSLLPLHASAIEIDGYAIAFCGDSGAGKSTTAAIFSDAGYPIITDDVLSLKQNDVGIFQCYPGPAISKLNSHSMELIQQSLDATEFLIDKYHSYNRNWTSLNELPLKAIYAIESNHDIQEFRILPLQGIEKIQTIMRYLYRNYWISSFGVEDTVNRSVIELATQLPVFKVQRPSNMKIKPDTILTAIQHSITQEVSA